MLDFYALPKDFPGIAQAQQGIGARQRQHLIREAVEGWVGNKMGTSFRADRFRFYLSMHEFEALLFSHPEALSRHFQAPASAAKVQGWVQAAGGAEEVNNSLLNAPSKRIKSEFPRFTKVVDPVTIATAIGLPAMRAACPLFNEWVAWLESLQAA